MADRHELKRKPVYLFFTTHWDREWYLPFQDFRYQLVELIDRLLELFAQDPSLPPFMLDGQYVLVEDYLEMRPYNQDALKKLIGEGRIVVGPWYTLPDEIIVSGESLVRNLELGIRESRDLGSSNPCGYLCDMFGHNSQMPQILKSFDLPYALLWRGVDSLKTGSEFLWIGADGSEVLTHAFPQAKGYGTTWLEVVRDFKQYGRPIDQEEAARRLRRVIRQREQSSPGGRVLLQMGVDHCRIDREVYDFLETFNSTDPDYRLVFCTMERFFLDYGQDDQAIASLQRVRHELRDPCGPDRTNYLIPHVGSSRIDQKQKNHRCENLLCFFAEPFSLFARTLKKDPKFDDLPFLQTAWKYLLKNQAHDSICGCSVDQVHRDMDYRFDQAQLIAERIGRDALRTLNRSHLASIAPKLGSKRIRFFNGVGRKFEGVVDFQVDFVNTASGAIESVLMQGAENGERSSFGREGVYFHHEEFISFDLVGKEGEALAYQILAVEREQRKLESVPGGLPQVYPVERYRLSCALTIPSCGTTDLLILPRKQKRIYRGSLFRDSSTLENEYLRIVLEPEGTLSITNLETGKTYRGDLEFLLSTDIGDGYIYHYPVNGATASSKGTLYGVSKQSDGPIQAVLELKYRISFPPGFDLSTGKPDQELVEQTIAVQVRLKRDSRQIEFLVAMDNILEQVRLQVLFPTEIPVDEYHVLTPFDVYRRTVFHPGDGGHNEPYPEYGICQGLVVLQEKENTAALLLRGLPEAGVLAREDRALAVTLLRSSRRTVFTSGAEDGLLAGHHEFEFALALFNGSPTHADLVYRTLLYQNPPRFDQRDFSSSEEDAHLLESFEERSFMQNESAFVLTAVRNLGEGSYEIRGFNPETRPISVDLVVDLPFRTVRAADLLGEKDRFPIAIEGKHLRFELPAKRIATLLFEE